jgi:hypothetical protein
LVEDPNKGNGEDMLLTIFYKGESTGEENREGEWEGRNVSVGGSHFVGSSNVLASCASLEPDKFEPPLS